MLKKTFLLSIACLLISANFAKADTIKTFTLDQDACTGTCGTAPFGTIVLDQSSTGVTVTETLKSGETYAITGAGKSLEFNLANTFSITNLTAGFNITGAATASAFGSFTDSVDCGSSLCANGGKSTNYGGPITFFVAGAQITDFTANSGGYYFTSDVLGLNGNTGNVGAKGGVTTTPVPEPSSLLLLGTGIIGVAGALRRKMMA